MAVTPGGLLDSPGIVGGREEELDTPAVVVDLERLERNIREWQAAMDAAGVRFRPHVKTHKIPEIAAMQTAAGAVGIIAAKVSEAEVFERAGIRDICIAFPVIGRQKWQRVAEMARRGVRVVINVDSETGARGLSEAADAAGVTILLQIDVDSGMHRGGIPPADVDDIETLARTIMRLPGIEFDGITTHRGLSFDGATTPEEAGHEEGGILVRLAEKLGARGVPVHEITAGSTFTGRWVAEVPGVTEARAGTYVFYDLMHVGAGTATFDQLALSVLCTVVSRAAGDRITIDAGSKTFSNDHEAEGRQRDPQPISRAAGRRISVDWLTEEHGMARTQEEVEIGEKISFYPYHACPCVNLTNEIAGVRDGRVERIWPVLARGLRN